MYIKDVAVEMERNHQKSLQAQVAMIKLFDKYLLGGEIPDNALSSLSLYFITKFHKSLLALRMLVISGFDEDASVILRTLVESTITLKFISKKPDERTVKFIEYEYIAKHRLMKSMQKHYPNENRLHIDVREQIINDFKLYKHKYPKGYQWSDVSLSMMAEETDMSYWYETVYQPDSSYVHSNISASVGFMQTDQDEGLLVAVGPMSFNATDLIAKSCQLGAIILASALENMSFSMDELESTWNHAQVLLSQEFSANAE